MTDPWMGTYEHHQALHRTNTARPTGHASSAPGYSSLTHAAPPLLGSPLRSPPPTHMHSLSPLEADRTSSEGTGLPIDMVSRLGSLNLNLAIDSRADDPLDPWDPTLDNVLSRPSDDPTLGSSLGQASTHRSSLSAAPLGSSLSHSSQIAMDPAIMGSSIPVDHHPAEGSTRFPWNNLGNSTNQAPDRSSHGPYRDGHWAQQPASSLGTSLSGVGQAFGTSFSAHSNLSSGYSTSHLETPAAATVIWGSSALGGQEWGVKAEGRRTSNGYQPSAAFDPFIGASVSSLSPVSPTMHKLTGPTQTTTLAAPWHGGSSWAPPGSQQAHPLSSISSSSSHSNTADRWGSVGPIAITSPPLTGNAAWNGSMSAGIDHSGTERVHRVPAAPIGRKPSGTGDPSLSSYVDPLLTSTSPPTETTNSSVQLSRPEPSLMVGFSTPRLNREIKAGSSSTPLGTRDSSNSTLAAPKNAGGDAPSNATLASPAPTIVSGLSATRSRFMASSASSGGPGHKKEVDADGIFLLE